ncbi:duplicated orphan permease [Maribacter sedimenticola]|uniref:Duplicated orphan permease n=1 Tax=Maribacter sedimenticola TaxID=228956 RepID=A0ABY1SIG8_9FLAO|nr:ABC transporter permease [Maribacter sedimenticola]SNR55637.1 duplicated orphan permease [Maribacter sedimenticola]
MFKNYLKIAWRNLWKNKGYSMLNIFGLAIGITCAAMILLWVEDEVGYDANFDKQNVVYYVPTNQQYEGEWRTFFQATPGPLAAVLKEEVPGIVGSARTKGEDFLFQVGETAINKNGRYADPDFLSMFSLSFVEGNLETAFKNVDAIVISQETATQLFGEDTSAMHKVVKINNETNFTVTGVYEDLPHNVTYSFDWVAPFERFAKDNEWVKEYGANFSDTFVELSPEANVDVVNNKVKAILPLKTEDDETIAFLFSMKDWHLRSAFEGGKNVGGQITYVRLFSLIALIILLIACINFMNLATARSEKRANEVGVRKVLGSGRKGLISQFMAEAIITAGLSAVLSVLLLKLLVPQFNTMIGKQLALNLFNPTHLLTLLSITLICGLVAGWYPAFYLSSFKPVDVLKGARRTKGSASMIRKGLVATQFVVSIVFIISTIIVYQQVQHVKGRDLGYNKENLVKIPVTGDMIKNFKPIEEDIKASGMIESIGFINTDILSGGNNTSGLSWQGGVDTEDVLVSVRDITADFFNTTGMKIIDGRGFSNNPAQDSVNIIVSESFAKLMGSGSAVGKTIEEDYPVIGVVKDYVYGDMYGSSDPVIFFNDPSQARFMYVKTKTGMETVLALNAMEATLHKFNPAFPFEYEFVDDTYDAKFKSEQLIGNLSQVFALLAILISCLGLFGLSAFTADQRRKEIGVRKVLGSSITGIVGLLSKDFMKLVGMAIIIATPIAWLLMQNWLEGFAYRTSINAWAFIIAGAVAIVIALLTISFQAFNAARVNPVKSLRTE